jgi:glycosyltransferase involved in cell wall biosynthesis
MKEIVIYSTQLMETGGIESHLFEFCKHMGGKSISIDLVVLNAKITPSTEASFRKFCRYVILGNNKSSFQRLIWLIMVALKLRYFKYDAIYTNGQGESIGVFARLLRTKGAWIHHHHTSGDKNDQATWGSKYLRTLKEANTVIACSLRNAQEMANALSRAIDTIPCFSRKITVNRTALNELGKIRFGYFGRLIPEKGIDLLCKMSEDSDLQNVEFHIWGEGEAYPPSFFYKFPKLNYHGSFFGLSGLTNAIASIDGFLLLSVHSEGLPICLLEAMSAGLPWLATDRGGISDIACDPNSTRVIPTDFNYEQVKQAIKFLRKTFCKEKSHMKFKNGYMMKDFRLLN